MALGMPAAQVSSAFFYCVNRTARGHRGVITIFRPDSSTPINSRAASTARRDDEPRADGKPKRQHRFRHQRTVG